MRTAIYARVSSKKQRDEKTIEAQLRDLPEYARTMGWTVTATLVDDGHSAKAGNLLARVGLRELLAIVEARRVDVVLVWDVDRFTRSEDIIERSALIGALQRADVLMASPSTGALDLNTFAGDMIVNTKASMSAEWLRQHRARIKAGKASAIARNRKPAGPTPYGWSYTRATGVWKVRDDQAAIVREVLHRVAAGETCHELARDLNRRGVPRPGGKLWHPEQVWAIARGEQWSGSWVCDKRKGLSLSLPPLATTHEMDAARAALARHRRHTGPRAKHVYLLERIATCHRCGSRVGIASAEPSSGIRATYVCARRRRVPDGEAPCALPRHPIAEADAQVWAALRDAIESEKMAAVLLGREAGRSSSRIAQIEGARRDLARLARARTVALSHHATGLLDDIALADQLKRVAELERDAGLRLAAAEATPGAESPDDPQAIAAALEALRAACEAAGPERRRELVRRLAARVEVLDDRIRLQLRLPDALLHRSSNHLRAGSSTQRIAGQVVTLLAVDDQARRRSDEAVAAAIARAQVPPPPYLQPVRVVGDVVRNAERDPLELRTCATCSLTYWARADQASRYCSRRCAAPAGWIARRAREATAAGGGR